MRTLAASSILAVSFTLVGCAETKTEPTPVPVKDVAAAGHHPAPSSMHAASQPTAGAAPVGKGATPDTRDQVDEDGVVRRGAKLSTTAVLSVADCAAKASELNGKQVKVTGKVEKVCVKKGCWFAVADGDQSIRVTMKDYGFFVPKASVGKTAVIEGQLEVKELSEEEAKHLAEDGGKDPAEITGAQKELRIISAGLELS